MITAIVAIIGALTGMVPGILQFLTLKANNAQQIELAKLQMEANRQNIALQVDLANATADIEQQKHVYGFAAGASGIKWVDALAVFVRPYITLVMFHTWIALEVMLLLYAVANGVTFNDMAAALWDQDTKNLFAAIIGFWFGDRMLKRSTQMPATTAVMQSVPKVVPVAPHGPAPDGSRTDAPRGSFIPDPPGSRT